MEVSSIGRRRTASAASAAIDEEIVAYERQLRQQILFDEELADLAARQRAQHRLLPVLQLGPGTTHGNGSLSPSADDEQ